ncbi:hypothetical protein NDU88_005706 [Pleurodeles waltl]|uniref:Uncharacterized protein n=1 Tax=Pleurodeles waltl TaxID=8319 RepID=A0AAV7SMG9_PLEWA|nr:hypothetical protein NDU88_005706 [Pleurodeles waltl]
MTRSQGTGSPPPVKALKLESGRRDRVKTPGGKATHRGPKGTGESAVTPPKVGKGQRKSAQPVVSLTAEKGGIIPGGRDATASTVVTCQETTAGVIAQEGPSIVTGQETTAGVSAQEGPSIITGQETTAGVSAQEGPSMYLHWSGDHRRSQCPGGPKYCHWSGDHRRSHCPGGPKYRHWSGDNRRSQCPGGTWLPQPWCAMRERHATHQCPVHGTSCHTPMPSLGIVMPHTNARSRDRHGKALLNSPEPPWQSTTEQS